MKRKRPTERQKRLRARQRSVAARKNRKDREKSAA
jgi:hypothetical protein